MSNACNIYDIKERVKYAICNINVINCIDSIDPPNNVKEVITRFFKDKPHILNLKWNCNKLILKVKGYYENSMCKNFKLLLINKLICNFINVYKIEIYVETIHFKFDMLVY